MASRKKSVSAADAVIDIPVASGSHINRQATSASSVYQKCVTLRTRLARVPDFVPFIQAAAGATDDPLARAGLASNPVSQLWACFRLGSSLCFLYNSLGGDLLEVSPNATPDNASECKKGVARFIMAVKRLGEQLKADSGGAEGWTSDDLFTVTDLYKNDTNGFVKVLHCVSVLLDRLEKLDLLMDTPAPLTTALPLTTPPNSYPSSSPLMSPGVDGLASPIEGHSPFGSIATLNGAGTPVLGGGNADRSRIVRELIETERKYIMDLELLQSYAQTLRQRNVLSHDTIHLIFSNLNSLVDFQRRCQIGLEGAYEVEQAGGFAQWGEVFCFLENDFECYELFCANYNVANEIICQEQATLSQLDDILASNYEVQALLIKPIQRVCKYPLLLNELLKKTETDSPAYEDLARGLESIKRVADAVNEKQRKQENIQRVKELEARVEDWKGHHINQFGALVLEDIFTVIKNDLDREYHVYLFEKIILCCKELHAVGAAGGNTMKDRKMSKSNSILKKKDDRLSHSAAGPKPRDTPLQLKGRIYLTNVTAVKSTTRGGPHNLEVWWRGDVDQESFTLKCRHEEQLEKWRSQIEKLMEGRAAQKAAQEAAIARGEISPGYRTHSTHGSISASSIRGYSTISATHGRRMPGLSSAFPQTPMSEMGGAHPGWGPIDDDGASEYDPSGRATPSFSNGFARRAPSMPPQQREADDPPVTRQQRARTEDSNGASIQQWRNHQAAAAPPMPDRQFSQQSNASTTGSERSLRHQGSRSALSQAHHAPPLPTSAAEATTSSSSSSSSTATVAPRSATPVGLPPGAAAPMLRNRSLSSPNVYRPQGPRRTDTHPPLPTPPGSSPMQQSSSSQSWNSTYPAGKEGSEGSASSANANGSKSSLAGSDANPGGWTNKRFSETSSSTDISSDASSPAAAHDTAASSPVTPNGPMPPLPHSASSTSSQDPHAVVFGTNMRVKVRFNEDLFVLSLPPSIDHSSLLEKITRKVRLCGGYDANGGRLLKIKWVDEEGDQILVSGDEDVGMAMDWARKEGGGAVELVVS